MSTQSLQWAIGLGLLLSLSLSLHAYGHGEGGMGGGHDLQTLLLVPNPTVPEVAGARGKVLINLSHGVVELEDLKGFPVDTERNRILPRNVTSTVDPRHLEQDGTPRETSCHQEAGQWSCHVHSYVVWLVERENGKLGHAIPLGTIYPRTNGTAADRNFTFREGDLSGFGANEVIITAEETFGAIPSLSQGHEGQNIIEMLPRGPIVLQAQLP